jgi:hypothetical protein
LKEFLEDGDFGEEVFDLLALEFHFLPHLIALMMGRLPFVGEDVW